jgi:hypothetical protein
MLIYFIVFHVDDDNQVNDAIRKNRIWVEIMFTVLLQEAERLGIVVVVTAGDQVGTVILMRLSALYELTI